MTREDIIKLAQDAGMTGLSLIDAGYLERFAALVAAAEREACAKVCDERERANLYGVYECANEIRKRGEE